MEDEEHMWSDLLLQASILLLILLMFLFIYDVPRRLFSKLRLLLRRSDLQAKRHFVRGAQLLSQARSCSDLSLAERAASEADAAVSLDPSDAAAHILKALALELRGFRSSALDSLDAALSPLAAGSLSDVERSDALLKRAEIRLAADRGGVVEDVAEAERLAGESAKGYGLLGQWYEKKGLKEEARKAYQDAIRVRPDSSLARDGLVRLDA